MEKNKSEADEPEVSADREPQPDIWKIIDPGGRPVSYEPQELWEKAVEYFEWCKASPLKEGKLFGTGLSGKVDHPKAFTKQGFCAFAGISPRTFDTYAVRAEYEQITDTIRAIMFDQKFSAAAVGLMNPNLIARELGLADRIKQETQLTDMTEDQLEERYEELRRKAATDVPIKSG